MVHRVRARVDLQYLQVFEPVRLPLTPHFRDTRIERDRLAFLGNVRC